MSKLFVFDTNSLLSAALIENSINRKALDRAIFLGELAVSEKTMEEFIDVLFREKFDKYFSNDDERWRIANKIEANSKLFKPFESITDCRDPRDNKFLELAVTANASCIITGDNDLLVLNPFREIPIMNASDFFNNF